MEPLFQVETAHDADAYRHMVTVHYMLHQKNPVWALYALAVVLALFIWWMAAAGNYTSLSALGTGVFCLPGLLPAGRPLRRPVRRPPGVPSDGEAGGEGRQEKRRLRQAHPLPLL